MQPIKFLKLIVLTSALSLTALAQTSDESRLSVSDSFNVYIGKKMKPLVLKATTDQKPLLKINLKRTLRLVDTAEERAIFEKQGVSLDAKYSHSNGSEYYFLFKDMKLTDQKELTDWINRHAS